MEIDRYLDRKIYIYKPGYMAAAPNLISLTRNVYAYFWKEQ